MTPIIFDGINKSTSYMLLHHSRTPKKVPFFYIDVSNCNLKCVMCPQGQSNYKEREPEKLMSFELFQKIIAKLILEEVRISEFIIGNWGDPLLNPDLPRMIGYFRRHESRLKATPSVPIWVSTNLNRLFNPSELLQSGINTLNISISGMTQKTYSRNHRGGNINQVLKNIETLVAFRDKLKPKNITLKLFFLEFIYNRDEIPMAQEFCSNYGLEFGTYKGFLFVEDNLKLIDGNEYIKRISSHYINLDLEHYCANLKKRFAGCFFRDKYIVIDFDGQIYPCCLHFDQKYRLGNLFDYHIKDIPKTKCTICQKCLKKNMYCKDFVFSAMNPGKLNY